MTREFAWWDDEWCAYDLETTGVDTETAHVVQAAIVRYRGGIVLDRRQVLCNPGVPIPAEATAIHGISDEMVASARPEVEVLNGLVKWLSQRAVILTYNGMGYDDKIVQRVTGLDLDIEWQNAARVDVLALIRTPQVGKWWKGSGRHRLGAVAAKMGISIDGALHDAATDAETTARVLTALLHPQTGFASFVKSFPADWRVTMRMKDLCDAHEADFQRWKAKQPKKEGPCDTSET